MHNSTALQLNTETPKGQTMMNSAESNGITDTMNSNASILNTEEKTEIRLKRESIKQAFKAFVNAPESKPYHDSYGTKHKGKVNLRHFVIYALLKGLDPKRCSHDPSSENFIRIMLEIKRGHVSQNVLDEAFGGLVSTEDLQASYARYNEDETNQ